MSESSSRTRSSPSSPLRSGVTALSEGGRREGGRVTEQNVYIVGFKNLSLGQTPLLLIQDLLFTHCMPLRNLLNYLEPWFPSQKNGLIIAPPELNSELNETITPIVIAQCLGK